MTNKELWQAVLGELELSISKASFTTWFKNTAIFDLQKDSIVISVPNIFAKEWLEKKYKKGILDSIRRHHPAINSLACTIENQQSIETSTKSLDSIVITTQKKHRSSKTNSYENITYLTHRHNLNPRYTFENFVVGSNNELACAACKSVSETPGENYNPLFIYGGVGLGKTHLLQSTGNHAFSFNKNLKIRYVSMERFTNELVDAIQKSKAKEFKNKYIQLDMLILDDVQFLSGKEKTQEEFFHVFESLYQHGKQIILSSDRAPKSIPTLEDRLRSRFEGGMMADVNKPDLETRVAIIKTKLLQKNFSLPNDIVEYLAEHIYHNVRELEGALNKIIVTNQLTSSTPSLKDVVDMTRDVISINRQKDLSPKQILDSVANYYNIKPDEIAGRCRKKKVVKPRQVAIYLLRQEISLSFPEIGQLIGGRDHSTAIYAVSKIKKELKKNNLLQDQIKFIREKFIEY